MNFWTEKRILALYQLTTNNLASCIYKHMATSVGCKPFWMKDPSSAILTPCKQEEPRNLLSLVSLNR